MLPKRPLVRQFWNWVLPILCLNCGQESDWLCEACLSRLSYSRSTQCAICAKAAQDGLCQHCQQFTRLDGLVSLFPYRLRPIEQLVKTIKYQGHFDALYWFTAVFARQLDRRLPARQWRYLPIPLSQERLRHRGFNQAALLAKQLAAAHGPVVTTLVRNRSTHPQAELTRAERLRNLTGCFAWANDGSAPVEVVVVDDVVTTGATLREAAKTLRRVGSKVVWAVTIAHG